MSDYDQQVVKTGVQYSNRVFIGNLHTRMAEYDVCTIMRHYKFYPEDIKVIRDVNGCSKGYCFVDFRSENEAKRLLAQENIESKFGRKLLIKPAIRIRRKEVLVVKQQTTASHALECSASPDMASRGYPSQDHTPTTYTSCH
ncbi:protein boule-like [Bolinopsis microptera]|uniref:protein boule-like n=1 Tax=Bolinopsis microptera TaxID=2820187 RepID=UPI0030794795